MRNSHPPKNMILAASLLVAMSGASFAHTVADADLTVHDAWTRATPEANASGVVYLTILDKGAPDTLTGARTPVAAAAGLHESRIENGIMKMRTLDSLPVDRNHPITLSPHGYHLMLTGLTQPLKAGDAFPLTLTFARAGVIETVVKVEKPGFAPHTTPTGKAP